jgi:DNA-binding CsgD family transcriptional regulator
LPVMFGVVFMSRRGNGISRSRVGDVALMAKILEKLDPPDEPVQRKRKLVAEFCKMVGDQMGRPAPRGEGLAPRVQQTLDRLLVGDSEKQIASHLGLSPHTIHIYIKNLYKHYGVSSRGELFARFVRGGSSPKQAIDTKQLLD